MLKIGKLSWFRRGAFKTKIEWILQETLVLWFEELLLNLSLYVEAGLLVCHFTALYIKLLLQQRAPPCTPYYLLENCKTGSAMYDLHSVQKIGVYKACVCYVFILNRANVAYIMFPHTQLLAYKKLHKSERRVHNSFCTLHLL